MVVPKICGLETEYGITHRGAEESNPITASSLLINAYLSGLQHAPGSPIARVEWDFEDEMPGRDARGVGGGDIGYEPETHLVNAVLTNGSRYYVDHAHPEISGPECADARSAVVWDRAADLIAQRSMEAARALLPEGQELVVYKNNSDGKGNSYGCHENYLMDRATPFGRIVHGATPHFVTRQIFCGAGKVGTEAAGVERFSVPFQLSQRADFFEEEVGLETTLKRPIVNTRDEPHADARHYRRLHVIVGDANLAEVATFLKVGTTALVLALVEHDLFPDDLALAAPVQAIRAVSCDLSLRRPFRLADGTSATALDVQWELLERCAKYCHDVGTEAVGGAVADEVLARWETVLTQLETEPLSPATTVDWVAKYRLLDAYRSRNGCDWNDSRLQALDLQYHDLRPERSVADRLSLERLVDAEQVRWATENPPPDTRAYFRGRCLQQFSSHVVAANWDSVVFDLGGETLRRVPMMEPARGTRQHVASLFDECPTPADLIGRLQQ
ncbi:MAG: depupylase/deamidase Dop [bacterium]|nr:depupylase/deamidase Dop [bacterium]MXV90083.1 proteasome accessory factor PafA2 [Acidimicrobiia bacterium]MYC46487.1 proteasome accessory factor PafA2 [Acidimicrobiia bacterium]